MVDFIQEEDDDGARRESILPRGTAQATPLGPVSADWNPYQQAIFWAGKQQDRRRERKARNDAEEAQE